MRGVRKLALVSVLGVVFAGFSTGIGISQRASQSASELIRFLTYQSDRPEKPAAMLGLQGCGHFEEDRAVAKALAKLGTSAVPALEEALDSVNKDGQQSPFALGAGWLLFAYAQIRGSAAHPRLEKMAQDPALAFLNLVLDRSQAIAFGLTSYVSATRVPARIFRCSRVEQPRDALDQLILAWERNDLPLLQASLGPRASAALAALMEGSTWDNVRGALWRGGTSGVAVGYRFEIPGKWAEPEATLQEDSWNRDFAEFPSNPNLETLFKDRSGVDCAPMTVNFVVPPGSNGSTTTYLVDNPDLRNLLRSIGSCAGKR